MTKEAAAIAARFAAALDEEDYFAVKNLLGLECEYLTPKGTLVGPNAIVASYQDAAAWAKSNVESVKYSSEVREGCDGCAVITFYDHFEHDGFRHTYACEQEVYVNDEGRVSRIVHQALPGQLESAYQFLRSIGVGPNTH